MCVVYACTRAFLFVWRCFFDVTFKTYLLRLSEALETNNLQKWLNKHVSLSFQTFPPRYGARNLDLGVGWAGNAEILLLLILSRIVTKCSFLFTVKNTPWPPFQFYMLPFYYLLHYYQFTFGTKISQGNIYSDPLTVSKISNIHNWFAHLSISLKKLTSIYLYRYQLVITLDLFVVLDIK